MPGLNLIDVIWPMMAATSLTLAVIFFFIWIHLRAQRDYLAFALFAVCVWFYTFGEWSLMRATTPEAYGDTLRWMMVVVPIGVILLAAFIRWHLRAGRDWLFWSVCGLRLLGIPLNFLFGANVVYSEITELQQQATMFGDSIAMPVGVPGPFHWLVNNLADILLVLFLADATHSAWRRGDALTRRRALLVGGGTILFFLIAAGHATLLHAGLASSPYLISISFLGIVLVMSYQLGFDVFRSVHLAIQLRESEQRMELAVHAARLGLWEWDIERDVFWANDTGYAMFSFLPGERVDFDRFSQRIHPEERAAVVTAVHDALANHRRYEKEYRIVLPSGDTRWMHAWGQAEYSASGKPTKLLGVVLDATERKLAEQRQDEIERLAKRQRDELAHLSRVAMLGELSGALAHELNQPLTSILSNAQAAQLFIARGVVSADEIGPILDDIVKADRRAGDIIRRLRRLLKKDDSTRQWLDLNEVVSEVLRLTNSDRVSRGITIQLELSPDLPPVYGDEVQLQQVLLNLLNNACDAIEAVDALPALTVRTVCEAGNVIVSVADRGSGIGAEDLERIFEPFVTTKAKGLGLGLSICRTIIQAHGGRLWAENRQDGGAVFHFVVPVA
jgi:two-component system sensor kinase FixL